MIWGPQRPVKHLFSRLLLPPFAASTHYRNHWVWCTLAKHKTCTNILDVCRKRWTCSWGANGLVTMPNFWVHVLLFPFQVSRPTGRNLTHTNHVDAPNEGSRQGREDVRGDHDGSGAFWGADHRTPREDERGQRAGLQGHRSTGIRSNNLVSGMGSSM